MIVELIVDVAAHVRVVLPDTITTDQAEVLVEQALQALNSGLPAPHLFTAAIQDREAWIIDREATSNWEVSDIKEN